MIGNRITRIVAGVLSCILVGVFTANLANIVIRRNEYDVHMEYGVSDDMNELYYKLWAVGTMYLRNIDENGKFSGSEYLEKQTVSALQKLGCMDSNGNLIIDDDYNYEYLVSYGTNKFSNTDKSYNELDGSYSLIRKNDSISYPQPMYWFYTYTNNSFNMYDTNYGMHYYYLNGDGVALFDFDTKGLNFYIDELGATMYYKTDGSTPIPDDVFNYSYNSNYYENVYDNQEYTDEDSDNVPRGTSAVPRDNGLYLYDASSGDFIRFESEKFRQVQVQEQALTIAIKPNDTIIADWENYNAERENQEKQVVNKVIDSIPLLVIALLLLIFVLVTGGYNKKEHKFAMSWVEKVFAEIPVAVAIATVLFGGMAFDELTFYGNLREFFTIQEICILIGVIYALLFGIAVAVLNTLVVRLKCKCFVKSTLIYKVLAFAWKWLKKFRDYSADKVVNRDMLRNDKFTRRFIVRTVAFTGVETFLACVFIDFSAYGILLFFSVILFAGYFILSLLDLSAMNRISKHITAINQGDYSPHIEDKGSSAYCMTEKLNNISAGIQSAVDRQLQSERMKIDLVTNVSHDLKTPLTSIISYIDLLSSEELSPEARDYVNIIENKSQRLKTMVADLFDLAKATSRTDIDVEKIDAVILTKQVLADLSDKIEATGKQLKIDIQADSAPVMAEGKKMYRVLQNIIDNALKYSMDGTRIYFTLKNTGGYCSIAVKNIASYEMNFSPDEITERFTRGDESRSTEGNGLGLSIAKSFTEACGGFFKINVDGDVFTAEIRLAVNI